MNSFTNDDIKLQQRREFDRQIAALDERITSAKADVTAAIESIAPLSGRVLELEGERCRVTREFNALTPAVVPPLPIVLDPVGELDTETGVVTVRYVRHQEPETTEPQAWTINPRS